MRQREWGRRSDGEGRVWRKEGRGVMGDGTAEKGKELVRGVIGSRGSGKERVHSSNTLVLVPFWYPSR